jgi:N-hydroxyarylamine O-acetyltransferase
MPATQEKSLAGYPRQHTCDSFKSPLGRGGRHGDQGRTGWVIPYHFCNPNASADLFQQTQIFMPLDKKQYLHRINYRGGLNPTPETLSALQEAHLMSVPFENLDIHNNVKIDLTNLYDKIVLKNRGGFCYELNGLFCELLKELGFSVKMVSARVYQGEKGFGVEFDHMALKVSFGNDEYLADVGFGEFTMRPLKIELNSEASDPLGIFRIEKFNDIYKVVKQKDEKGEFFPRYLFSDIERVIVDFNEMCLFHQTSSESHFTQNKICSLPVKDGRITLSGRKLIATMNGKAETKELESDDEVKQVLKTHFNIVL